MISAAIIFDNFGPYHVARLRAASGVCGLTAIEVAGSSATYSWESTTTNGDFKRITLAEKQTSEEISAVELRRRLDGALDEIQPAVVMVPGWASQAAWGAMKWCLARSVPMIVMSESTEWDEPRFGWKEGIKKRLVGLFSAALAGGARHRDYLEKLGMPAGRIHFGYDAIDNHYFRVAVDKVRSSVEETRRRRPLPEVYFLASARFVEKKNLVRLLEAYALYRKTATPPAWSLVLLGDGALRSQLEARIAELGLRDHVRMPGFVQYGELPNYYALAGAFVHPSTIEPWGLVVNEAMASGLPVLVSERCGCVPELVREGENGFTFDPLSIEEMAEGMRRVAAADFPRADFAGRSSAIVADWGPERFARGVAQAIEAALTKPPPSPSAIDRVLLSLLMRR